MGGDRDVESGNGIKRFNEFNKFVHVKTFDKPQPVFIVDGYLETDETDSN